MTWMLPGNLPHIGIVTDRRTAERARPLVVHNIGRGPQLEDVLFEYPLTGHFVILPRSEGIRHPVELAGRFGRF